MPEFGSVDITATNVNTQCGLKSDPVKVLTMCDLGRAVAPRMYFTSDSAPAGGAITLKWDPLPAVRQGELFKINWYTSKNRKTHEKNSF